jgi:hypothetical protein
MIGDTNDSALIYLSDSCADRKVEISSASAVKYALAITHAEDNNKMLSWQAEDDQE